MLDDTGTTAWFAERADDLAVIATPLDFLGINYYSRHTVAGPGGRRVRRPVAAQHRPRAASGSEFVDTGAPKTDMGWEVHPDGLVDVIEMVHDRAPELPVLITENGAAYADVVEAGRQRRTTTTAGSTSWTTSTPAARRSAAACRCAATSPGA